MDNENTNMSAFEESALSKKEERRDKAKETANKNLRVSLNSILNQLETDDVESFHRLRSALLAFKENSYDGHQEEYKRIITYSDFLKDKMTTFFQRLGLGNYFVSNIEKATSNSEQ